MTVLYTRGRVRAALLALGLAAALCTTGCATVLTTVTSAALCSSTGQSRGCMGDVPRTGLAIDGAVLEHALRSGPRTTRAVEVRRFVCDGALHTAPSRIEARTRCVGALEARGIEAGLGDCQCEEQREPANAPMGEHAGAGEAELAAAPPGGPRAAPTPEE